MSRSKKKIPIFNYKVFYDISDKKFSNLKNVKDIFVKNLDVKLKKRLEFKDFIILNSKNMVLYPYMLGINFLVYNGRQFVFILIKPNMPGLKIGEFVLTKSLGYNIHLNKKKKKKVR
jgi:ribosomal protein S19